MQAYREREGLSEGDAKEICDSFHKHESRSGQISLQDVGRVLRAIGYNVNFDVQQTLSSKVDLAGRGYLNIDDMQKLVRMIVHEDVELMKKEFHKYGGGSETIPVCLVSQALVDIGCINPDGTSAAIPLKHKIIGDMNLCSFCSVALRHRRTARRLFQENGGFSSDELEELRAMFTEFDTDGSGDIARHELIHLFEQLMPKYANDAHERQILIKLINEVDVNNDGTLDFDEFVRLVRRAHDFEAQSRISKETLAVEATHFSVGEVQGFRDIFVGQAGGERELDEDGLKIIMEGICPMGANNTQKLMVMFKQCLRSQADSKSKSSVASKSAVVDLKVDFPDFLRLMKQVIDTNFGNVREKFGYATLARTRANTGVSTDG